MDGDRTATSSVGYLVKRLQSLLNHTMTEALLDESLTVTEYAVLTAVAEEPGLSNADLARRAFVTPQSTHRVLSDLEERRLIARTPDPSHRRVLQAQLTPQGRLVLDAATRAVVEVEAAMLDGLDEKAVEHLRSALRRGVENLAAGGAGRR